MIVKLLTEHYLEFLRLIGGCRGSSESAFVKILICWKSHAAAQLQKATIKYISAQLGEQWDVIIFTH